MDEKKLAKLKEACDEFMRWLESDEYHEDSKDDYENTIYEAAMELFYGEQVWERINKVLGA